MTKFQAIDIPASRNDVIIKGDNTQEIYFTVKSLIETTNVCRSGKYVNSKVYHILSFEKVFWKTLKLEFVEDLVMCYESSETKISISTKMLLYTFYLQLQKLN